MQKKKCLAKATIFLLSIYGTIKFSYHIVATDNAVQNLVVTVPSTVDLKVSDPSLDVTFDPMSAKNGVHELFLSSSYSIVNVGNLRMITANISEELRGVDFFIKLSAPSGSTGGSLPVSRGEIKLKVSDQPVVSGIGNCLGIGEISYRAIATFANIPEGSFQQKVLVVTFTLIPST